MQLQRMKATASSTPSSPTFGRKRTGFRRIFSSTSSSPAVSRGNSPTRGAQAMGSEFRISQVSLLLQSVVDCDDASGAGSVTSSQDGINQRDVDLTRHLIHPELYDCVADCADFRREKAVQMSSSPDRVRSMSMGSLTPGMRKPVKDRSFISAIFHRMNRYNSQTHTHTHTHTHADNHRLTMTNIALIFPPNPLHPAPATSLIIFDFVCVCVCVCVCVPRGASSATSTARGAAVAQSIHIHRFHM